MRGQLLTLTFRQLAQDVGIGFDVELERAAECLEAYPGRSPGSPQGRLGGQGLSREVDRFGVTIRADVRSCASAGMVPASSSTSRIRRKGMKFIGPATERQARTP